MKEFKKKLISAIDRIYGIVIYLCLFVGGSMFFGYLAAIIIGGDTAVLLCDIIYNKIFKVLIYAGNVVILLGLVNMYLKKQKSLTMSDSEDMTS